MPKLARTRFVCQACGRVEPKWLGRCPDCEKWNSFEEEVARIGRASRSDAEGPGLGEPPTSLAEISVTDWPRRSTGLEELDRVLGGGLVAGSLVLLGGDPGIGKSTLLLQAMCGLVRKNRSQGPALYVSGEESVRQTALRAERLGAREPILVLAETSLERILAEAERARARVLAVDSIQTVHSQSLDSLPGSVSQVRESAGQLLRFAKSRHVPVILVGHVTKEGSLAGPKTLEHIVDTVLAFEGEPAHAYRILRATKNRFGSTNEIGVFEMRGQGLVEVTNPSEAFLAERPRGAPGSVVSASAEGSRPILVEIQALVATPGGPPRRTALGVDPNRVSLLLAVLECKAGIEVLSRDVFVNIAGGVRLSEPAVDLGVICAAASSARRQAADPGTVVFGEVGLAGEIRAVSLSEQRIAEAAKLGFARCILPEVNRARFEGRPPLELIGVRTVGAALNALLGR